MGPMAKPAKSASLVSSPTWEGPDVTIVALGCTLKAAKNAWSVTLGLNRPERMTRALNALVNIQPMGANAYHADLTNAQIACSLQHRACNARTPVVLPSASMASNAQIARPGTSLGTGPEPSILHVCHAHNVAATGLAATASSALSVQLVLSQTWNAQDAFSARPRAPIPSRRPPTSALPWGWYSERVVAYLLQMLRCAPSLAPPVHRASQGKSHWRTGQDACRAQRSATLTSLQTAATAFAAHPELRQMRT
jgi:hypothetical protein